MTMLSNHWVSSVPTSDSQDAPSTSYPTGICSFAPMNYGFHSTRLWIVDSRASRHICSHASMFISFKPVWNFTVTLPNNDSIAFRLYGDVRIASHFILKDVLFVPQFKYNLISISSFTATSGLTVIFFPGHFLT